MKKVLAILTVIALSFCVCACANPGYADDEIGELLRNPLYRIMKKKMGINYLWQEIDYVESDDEHVSVYLDNSQLIVSEYVFEMGDGSRLQLPMTYEDLCNAGWVLEYGMEEDGLSDPLPGEEYVWCSFINADGKTINAEISNHSSEPIDLREAVITQLQVGGDDTESFSVNGITRGATIEEILDEFGLPYGSSYYRWESGGESFSFYYIEESGYCSIDFSIDPETWLLDSICYCGPLYPDEIPE